MEQHLGSYKMLGKDQTETFVALGKIPGSPEEKNTKK